MIIRDHIDGLLDVNFDLYRLVRRINIILFCYREKEYPASYATYSPNRF